MNTQIKRILIGSSSPTDRGSGINTYSKQLTECLINKGFKLFYSCPEPNDDSWIINNDITPIYFNNNTNPTQYCHELLEIINSKNIDAIINNDNIYVQSIVPAVDIPSIAIGHLEKYTIASAACLNSNWMDYLVAISNDMQFSYIQKHNIPVSKCPVIHNGLLDPGKSNINNTSDKLTVIYCGGSDRRKGADLMLKLVRDQPDIFKKVDLHWFGDLSESYKKCLDKISYINVHGRVDRDTYMTRISNSDILLLPSRHEGCPMAILESLAMGIIPISSNGKGAMRWLIDSGIDGYICHLNKWPKQTSKLLSDLSNNKNLMGTLRTNARLKYETNFKMSYTADKIINLLNNPTVNRTNKPKIITIYKWHRPFRKTLVERAKYRLGILSKSGTINV